CSGGQNSRGKLVLHSQDRVVDVVPERDVLPDFQPGRLDEPFGVRPAAPDDRPPHGPVKTIPPQVVLAEDVPDVAGIGLAGGWRGEESTLREETGRVRFEAFRNDPAIGWHNAPRQPLIKCIAIRPLCYSRLPRK